MPNLIFFDMEGPLSPQDNAYELMKLLAGGNRLFEVVSRYDDLLALEGRPDYEPGDTLALILPFLLSHNISEGDIARLAEEAGLVAGAQELITWLKGRGWKVFSISTSYAPFASRIVKRVGIQRDNLACTHLPLDNYQRDLTDDDRARLNGLEQELLRLRPGKDDTHIKKRLDRFYWVEEKSTTVGRLVSITKPVGGQRKLEAIRRFAPKVPLEEMVVVGDSITDARMLEAVERAGGIAIAFNANEYALSHATLALASTHLSDLETVLLAWEEGGREAVRRRVEEGEKPGGQGDRGHFHWTSGRRELEEALAIHKRIRRLVREEAGKLG